MTKGTNTQDYIVRALCLEGKVRVYAVRSTELVNEVQRRHQTWATATAAIGRTLSVGAMMGAMLKGKEKLTIQVRGNGPIGKMMVDANAYGEVRGYVDNPQSDVPRKANGKLDVSGVVGQQGDIYVTKDLGLRDPYQGYSHIVSGEIGEDFTLYFAQSEQTPSAVSVGVLVNPDDTVKASGGFIIQLMPGAGLSNEFITQLEKRLGEIPPVSTMIDQGLSPEQMIEEIFDKQDIQWLGQMPIRFQCHCSEERVRNTLISLGRDEIQAILEDDQKAEVHCHFCNTYYHFNQTDLEQLLAEIDAK
ncbi:Hsp33 family molecular chaperone HslO [Bacillus horti]|uniref:33 kDa chaperonin n=1 Tax=Caldalkalibacillus horti TaxID=77523 RepID=A0ABT9W2X1_9BACI|nr:Hsp33 family molecular chaperone HslO [Bacillus horti]MDQ0167605.1 molecular chaperone Hsp33 [Bacillus horti]